MAKYLFQGSLSQQGIAGLRKEGGSGRHKAIEATITGLGGTVEAFYFAFGNTDVVVVADLPDNVAAGAVSTAVSASGAGSMKTTVLITPDEMDNIASTEVAFRPPGA
jgi:uncharacterized protein with GYD domain